MMEPLDEESYIGKVLCGKLNWIKKKKKKKIMKVEGGWGGGDN